MQVRRSLEFFPIQLFAVIMGLSGFVIVLAKAYHILDMPYQCYLNLFFHSILPQYFEPLLYEVLM